MKALYNIHNFGADPMYLLLLTRQTLASLKKISSGALKWMLFFFLINQKVSCFPALVHTAHSQY